MESNVMHLYVYKENFIKSFEPKMLHSTFLVRFHWILRKCFGQYNTLVYLKVGKSSLDIDQQWAMTEHVSCQTLSKYQLNAWLSSLLFAPSYLWILCFRNSFCLPDCLVNATLATIDFFSWENPSMIQWIVFAACRFYVTIE